MILIGVRINDGLSPHQEYTRDNFPQPFLQIPVPFQQRQILGIAQKSPVHSSKCLHT